MVSVLPLAHSQAEAQLPPARVQQCHQWVSEFVLCECRSAVLVEATSSQALTLAHRRSDGEHHCALVAVGENGYRPLGAVYHFATAIAVAVRIHVQHFSVYFVADIHVSAAPGWKQRTAELCLDVVGRSQQEEATCDLGRHSSNLLIEILGDHDH